MLRILSSLNEPNSFCSQKPFPLQWRNHQKETQKKCVQENAKAWSDTIAGGVTAGSRSLAAHQEKQERATGSPAEIHGKREKVLQKREEGEGHPEVKLIKRTGEEGQGRRRRRRGRDRTSDSLKEKLKSVRRQRLFIREVPRTKGGGSPRSSLTSRETEGPRRPRPNPEQPGFVFFQRGGSLPHTWKSPRVGGISSRSVLLAASFHSPDHECILAVVLALPKSTPPPTKKLSEDAETALTSTAAAAGSQPLRRGSFRPSIAGVQHWQAAQPMKTRNGNEWHQFPSTVVE